MGRGKGKGGCEGANNNFKSEVSDNTLEQETFTIKYHLTFRAGNTLGGHLFSSSFLNRLAYSLTFIPRVACASCCLAVVVVSDRLLNSVHNPCPN